MDNPPVCPLWLGQQAKLALMRDEVYAAGDAFSEGIPAGRLQACLN